MEPAIRNITLAIIFGFILGIASTPTIAKISSASASYIDSETATKSAQNFQLNEREAAWLSNHPRIRIGTMNAWPPMDFVDRQGKPQGIGARFIEALNLRLNNSIEIVPGLWADIYADAKERRLDALMGITPRSEREEFFNFTKPYVTIPHAIFARNDSPYLKDLSDLKGRRVGVERGFFIVNVLRDNYPEVEVTEYDSTSDALDAVAKGEVDVYIGNRAVAMYIIETELISNIQQYGKISETSSINTIGVRKDWPILRDILQKALDSLTIDEMRAIMREWVDIPKSSYALLLNDREQQWLDSKNKIRVAAMDAWPPFNFIDSDGKPAGIGSDIVESLNRRLEGKLKLVPGAWKELYDGVKEQRLDAIMDITPKPAREEFFNFTKPYLDVPHVIVAQSSVAHIANEDGLVGKVLALEKGFGNVKYFRQNYPEVTIREYRDTAHALGAVVRGEVDAYAGNRGVALYLIEKELMTNLKIHGRLRKDGSILALGTRKDWPILRDILQKALDDITHVEYRLILGKWVSPEKEEAPGVNLSLGEKQWLAKHSVIRVSSETDWPPYDFTDGGQPSGYAIDYMKLLADKLGVQFDFITASWTELYEKFNQGEIDLIHPLHYSKEREAIMHFTEPFFTLSNAIVVRNDSGDISSLKQLYGKTLASAKGWAMTDYVRKNHPQIKLHLVKNALEGLKAVQFGQADAWIDAYGTSHYLIDIHFMDNLKITGEVTDAGPFRFVDHYIGVRKDWSILQDILNKAIFSVNAEDLKKLNDKWRIFSERMRLLHLSYEERAWLANNPVIRTASDPSWAPIEYVDEEGNFLGISADYLKQLEELLGIKFEQVRDQTWPEMIESFKKGEIDLFSSLNRTPDREKSFDFSDSYTNFPVAIFSGPEVPYIGDLKELHGRRVGVISGYAAQERLAAEHPDIWLVPASSPVEALEQLSRGEVDAYVGNILVTGYYIGKLGYTHLKVVGETPYRYEQSMGVRKDWPIFTSILNKALKAIPETDKNAIYNRWVGVRYEYGFDYTLLWKVLFGAFVLFAIFIYWNRKLSHLNQQLIIARNQEEQARITVEQANEQLKTMDKLKSMFIASMSHELRTPLNSIIGFSGLLLQGVSGALNEKQQDSMQRINRAGNHLLGLISDVIDISKIEAGRIDAYPEHVSLKEVVDDAVESIRPLADAKGLILEVSIDGQEDSWPEMTADRKRLMQCLLNYLSNAVKFSDQGKVTLTVAIKDDMVEISVTDTGIGIAEEDLPKLFEAFERLESHLRVKAGGTGLGLYLTKKIAEEILHGSVSVESHINEGSTFRLEMPVNASN